MLRPFECLHFSAFCISSMTGTVFSSIVWSFLAKILSTSIMIRCSHPTELRFSLKLAGFFIHLLERVTPQVDEYLLRILFGLFLQFTDTCNVDSLLTHYSNTLININVQYHQTLLLWWMNISGEMMFTIGSFFSLRLVFSLLFNFPLISLRKSLIFSTFSFPLGIFFSLSLWSLLGAVLINFISPKSMSSRMLE